jgi:hypothetical protein
VWNKFFPRDVEETLLGRDGHVLEIGHAAKPGKAHPDALFVSTSIRAGDAVSCAERIHQVQLETGRDLVAQGK